MSDNTVFSIAQFDVNSIGRNYGQCSIPVSVKGYWSRDVINIYIRRNSFVETSDINELWKFEVSNSSGGRDTKEIADDAQAIRNYGQAMIAVADLIDQLKLQVAEFEQQYQARIEQDRKEREIAQAELAKKAAADNCFTREGATALLEQLTAVNGKDVSIRLFNPGIDHACGVITCASRIKTKFYLNSSVISRRDLVELLMTKSIRSSIVNVASV
jgi:hypothetical protein